MGPAGASLTLRLRKHPPPAFPVECFWVLESPDSDSASLTQGAVNRRTPRPQLSLQQRVPGQEILVPPQERSLPGISSEGLPRARGPLCA